MRHRVYKPLTNSTCGGCSYSELCDLADKYGALTFIDECHATGFLGETGRYLDSLELIDVMHLLDLYFINPLYGKSLIFNTSRLQFLLVLQAPTCHSICVRSPNE